MKHQSRAAAAPREGDASAGFSLLEVLVAMSILAVAMSSLYQAYGAGVRGLSAMDQHLQARLLAQSVLAEQTQSRKYVPGTVKGRQGPYAWTLTIEREPDRAAGPAPVGAAPLPGRGEQQSGPPPGLWALYRLGLTVTWSSAFAGAGAKARSFQLDTLRIGWRK
jgi:prepilin-type N-terminal cleavage/methylation domain-containing protein